MDEDTRRLTRAVVVRVEEVEEVMVGTMDSEGSTHEFDTDGRLMRKKILREKRERETHRDTRWSERDGLVGRVIHAFPERDEHS